MFLSNPWKWKENNEKLFDVTCEFVKSASKEAAKHLWPLQFYLAFRDDRIAKHMKKEQNEYNFQFHVMWEIFGDAFPGFEKAAEDIKKLPGYRDDLSREELKKLIHKSGYKQEMKNHIVPIIKKSIDKSIQNGKLGQNALLDERYEVVGKLGQGAQGKVFLVCSRAKKFFAAKVLDKKLSSQQDKIDDLMSKYDIISDELNHRFIVKNRFFEYDEDLKQFYVLMDYIEGSTLDDLLDTSIPKPRIGVKIIKQISSALAHAHANDIVHRDLKPGNILIRRKDHFGFLTDFDLMSQDIGSEITNFVGTHLYVSPEQHLGGIIQPKMDIFVLGILVHKILTGTHPFDATSVPMMVNRMTKKDPRLSEELPIDVQNIILKCLNKNPEKRPVDANEVALKIEKAYNTVWNSATMTFENESLAAETEFVNDLKELEPDDHTVIDHNFGRVDKKIDNMEKTFVDDETHSTVLIPQNEAEALNLFVEKYTDGSAVVNKDLYELALKERQMDQSFESTKEDFTTVDDEDKLVRIPQSLLDDLNIVAEQYTDGYGHISKKKYENALKKHEKAAKIDESDLINIDDDVTLLHNINKNDYNLLPNPRHNYDKQHVKLSYVYQGTIVSEAEIKRLILDDQWISLSDAALNLKITREEMLMRLVNEEFIDYCQFEDTLYLRGKDFDSYKQKFYNFDPNTTIVDDEDPIQDTIDEFIQERVEKDRKKTGMAYSTFDQVLKEVGFSENDLKKCVSEGFIRAFRDKDKMKFKDTDVQTLQRIYAKGNLLTFREARNELDKNNEQLQAIIKEKMLTVFYLHDEPMLQKSDIDEINEGDKTGEYNAIDDDEFLLPMPNEETSSENMFTDNSVKNTFEEVPSVETNPELAELVNSIHVKRERQEDQKIQAEVAEMVQEMDKTSSENEKGEDENSRGDNQFTIPPLQDLPGLFTATLSNENETILKEFIPGDTFNTGDYKEYSFKGRNNFGSSTHFAYLCSIPGLVSIDLRGCTDISGYLEEYLPQYKDLRIFNGEPYHREEHVEPDPVDYVQDVYDLLEASECVDGSFIIPSATELPGNLTLYDGMNIYKMFFAGDVFSNKNNLGVKFEAKPDFQDKHFSWIIQLKKLIEVDVSNTRITDQGLIYFPSAKELKILNISENSKITSVGIEFLKQVELLEILDISNCEKLTLNDIVDIIPYLLNLRKLIVKGYGREITGLQKRSSKINEIVKTKDGQRIMSFDMSTKKSAMDGISFLRAHFPHLVIESD